MFIFFKLCSKDKMLATDYISGWEFEIIDAVRCPSVIYYQDITNHPREFIKENKDPIAILAWLYLLTGWPLDCDGMEKINHIVI